MLCLLWGTGARVGDLTALTWADIGERTLTIPQETKTGKRTISITPRTELGIAILREHHPGTGADSVWPSLRSPANAAKNAIERGCQRAGVPKFSPHGLRRLAVDEFRRGGVSAEVTAAITGHSPITMMKHYRKVSALEVRAAMQKVRLGEVPAGEVREFKQREEG